MHISLIGMSNIGKSYWARRLVADGYEHINCDRMVEERLGAALSATEHGIQGVARWMGQPYEARYADTSRDYLACEDAAMREAIDKLRSATKPLVIDTTGSFVYLNTDITEAIRSLTQVVYFEASAQHRAELFRRYKSSPKPVIWGDSFAPQTGETPQQSLERCYTDLLTWRAQHYDALAHIRIPYERHRAQGATWDGLMVAEKKSAP